MATEKANGKPAHGEGREALLEAAIRVVASAGLRGLTIRSVAEEAGVTHGLVRYYFTNRNGLVHEAMLRAGAETIGETLESHPDGLRRLRETFPAFIDETADLQAFQFELALESRRQPEYLTEARELYDSYHEAMARFLEGAGVEISPGLVRLVYAACDGLAFQQLLYGRPENSTEALAALERILEPFVRDGVARSAD
jgi:AcrR family transcriptional regulator